MEQQYQLANNGQEVQQNDLNLLGETAALADDRTLAEFLKMVPFGSNVVKSLLPYFDHPIVGSETSSGPRTTVNAVAGGYLVRPFRALVGTRTAAVSDAKKNLRDIRSALFIGPGSGTNYGCQLIAPATNTDVTNSRWDLIYAAVAVDGNAAGVTRYIKDPTSLAIAPTTVVTVKQTTVTVGIKAGTVSATPALPTIDADTGTTFYIPICYVRIPPSFTSGTTPSQGTIMMAETPGVVAPTTGAHSVRVANKMFQPGGSMLTTTRIANWGSTGTKPVWFISPETIGMETLLIQLDLTSASSANWNIQDGGIVDDSRNWCRHYFMWQLFITTAAGYFASDFAATSQDGLSANLTPSGRGPSFSSGVYSSGMGQSFVRDGHTIMGDDKEVVLYMIPAYNAGMTVAGSAFGLYVDPLDSGRLKFYNNGVNPPLCKVFIKLDCIQNQMGA